MTLYQVCAMMSWAVQGFTKEDVEIFKAYEGLNKEDGQVCRHVWTGKVVTEFSGRSYKYSATFHTHAGKHGPDLWVRIYHHEVGKEPESGTNQALWSVPFDGII